MSKDTLVESSSENHPDRLAKAGSTLSFSLSGKRSAAWWTGKPPADNCPGVDKNLTIHSLAPLKLNECIRADILDYFDNTWTLTEVLFSALQNEEAFYRPPSHQLRHPLVFYYVHPAVFYINKLRVAKLLANPIHPYYEELFEIGVDEMSWDDLSKNQMQWPTIAQLINYRQQVYQQVRTFIETHPSLDKRFFTWQDPEWALFMAFEHERIHLETSSVLIRELPISLVRSPDEWPANYPLQNEMRVDSTQPNHDCPSNPFIHVSSKQVSIGKPFHTPTYGWDNEYGERLISVQAFKAGRSLVSNEEFRPFVTSGAYQDPAYWSEEGWRWRSFRNAKHPVFWLAQGPAGLHQYQLRLCFEIVPMQWSWPVEVNYHEAKAFCAWRTKQDQQTVPYRLITEAEHHCLRDPAIQEAIRQCDGHELHTQGINLQLAYGSSFAVDAGKATPAGFYDVFGNVWEWCEDHLAALPGFQTHPFYDDFSTPCFDGKHQLIMGGSFISTGDEASHFARFHFRPHFFQHAGFRLIQPQSNAQQIETSCLDAPPPHVNHKPCCSRRLSNNPYETEEILGQYLLLHYGDAEQVLAFPCLDKNLIAFPKRCAEFLMQTIKKLSAPHERVLDLGCAVGGTSFELTRQFAEVIGIDLSKSFIQAAQQLQKTGRLECLRKEEGLLFSPLSLSLAPAWHPERVSFLTGDACALPADLGTFDAVILANLLCRVPDPLSCLKQMSGSNGLVRRHGLLVIISPYSWSEQFTPASHWLSAKHQAGKILTSPQGLKNILDKEFHLIEETNIPFVIRQHARKYEYIISHATVWQRK